MRDIMSEFIKHAKEQFGYDFSVKKSRNPDTFASLFQPEINKNETEDIENN